MDMRGYTEVPESVSEWMKGVGKKAIEAIFEDPSTGRWLKAMRPESIQYGKVVLDTETSRHMTDDRELLELPFTGPDLMGFMHIDIVHVTDGDNRGRCIFFDINSGGHELQGTVILPHTQEGGKALVTPSEQDEETEELGNLTEEDDDFLVLVRSIEHTKGS